MDADISSGDRGFNSTAIYHIHSYFTLTSLYHYTDFPESRVLVTGQCDIVGEPEIQKMEKSGRKVAEF